MTERLHLASLATGVLGLDAALGGGVPTLSFNLIAGGAGCGKTTLAHQIMFATSSPERPALYITILGEPPIKMLRYQQQFAFFDPAKLPGSIRYLHLAGALQDGGLEAVFSAITAELAASRPSLVFVDSFRSFEHTRVTDASDLQAFIQRLSIYLTGWEATTFLVGEYAEDDRDLAPITSVADGIIFLSQIVSRNSMVRKLRVLKMRGQRQIAGLHTVSISDDGLRVYPRTLASEVESAAAPTGARRSTGMTTLDDMLGGGVPVGYSLMIAGPSGSGKTVLASEIVLGGLRLGERAVIAVFEQRPESYLRLTPHGDELRRFVASGHLKLLDLRPPDLSVEETMDAISRCVCDTGAQRVVIDSLSGFKLALAPGFRDDFRESAYHLVAGLTALQVSIIITGEVTDSYAELQLAPEGIAFLTDGIVVQRYLELDGHLSRVIMVSKLRGFAHDHGIRPFEISARGLTIGAPLAGYTGLLSGSGRREA